VTKQQLYLFSCLYLAILSVVVVLTRATPRRLAGALVGAAVMGGAALGIVAIGESARWWHFVMTWEPYFLTLMWIGMIPCGFIFLITWRIANRFGWRGLAVVICVVAVVGPLRDSWYMAMFPEWGSYAPGFCADGRNLWGIRPVGDNWPRIDASGRRSCGSESCGPTPMATA
jgi:hypothetical protein